MKLHEAMYYSAEGDRVRCRLCPHGCLVAEGRRGLCLARGNVEGRLCSLNYGRVTSLALDPIEKKPLRRFYPGAMILSAGSFGCNFKCAFCQNYEISQQEAEARRMEPEELVQAAAALRARGNIGLAFTYNEPLVGYEFVLDTARLARARGLKNVLVTNGYVNKEPMEELLPFIDAMNIDLKAFDDGFYTGVCGGGLEPVKETIALCAKVTHVEVTTLVIPGQNDSTQEVEALSAWLAGVSPGIALHLTRYHPDYRMQEPPPITPERLEALAGVAKRHLEYVYMGNV
jgi:pyruvate formate lyase activating enzyme